MWSKTLNRWARSFCSKVIISLTNSKELANVWLLSIFILIRNSRFRRNLTSSLVSKFIPIAVKPRFISLFLINTILRNILGQTWTSSISVPWTVDVLSKRWRRYFKKWHWSDLLFITRWCCYHQKNSSCFTILRKKCICSNSNGIETSSSNMTWTIK